MFRLYFRVGLRWGISDVGSIGFNVKKFARTHADSRNRGSNVCLKVSHPKASNTEVNPEVDTCPGVRCYGSGGYQNFA